VGRLADVPHRSAGRRAARAIETIYGAEAIPRLDAILAADALEPDDRRSYERLRAALASR
jgi:hypothetical protein